MLIRRPVIVRGPDSVRISSRVESVKDPLRSDTLWLEFPADATVSDHSDPFLAAALQHAMHAGEDLHVEGAVSPRLFAAVPRIQEYFATRFPDIFHRISVTAEALVPAVSSAVSTEMSSFSGGVDSLYTMLRVRPSRLLFIQGFDIPLDDHATWDVCRAAYARVAAEFGSSLTTCRTNLRSTCLADGTPWDFTHGSALAAIALALGPQTSRFYIPSTHLPSDNVAWGSNDVTDPLFSTEATEIVNHDDGARRVDKTIAIADFPPAHAGLRICWQRPDGLRNCGHCAKCIRTMLTLDAIGALERFTTFPRTSINLRQWQLKSPGSLLYAKEVSDVARLHGRTELALSIERSTARSARVQSFAQSTANAFGLHDYHARAHLKNGLFWLAARLWLL